MRHGDEAAAQGPPERRFPRARGGGDWVTSQVLCAGAFHVREQDMIITGPFSV